MKCQRCGKSFDPSLPQCPGCGTPTVFMQPVPSAVGKDVVVVPEVLDSLDDLRPKGEGGGPMKPFGCTVGPGCGCLGMPVAMVAGLALTSILALAWVARTLGMLAAVLPELARRLGGRGPRRP